MINVWQETLYLLVNEFFTSDLLDDRNWIGPQQFPVKKHCLHTSSSMSVSLRISLKTGMGSTPSKPPKFRLIICSNWFQFGRRLSRSAYAYTIFIRLKDNVIGTHLWCFTFQSHVINFYK